MTIRISSNRLRDCFSKTEHFFDTPKSGESSLCENRLIIWDLNRFEWLFFITYINLSIKEWTFPKWLAIDNSSLVQTGSNSIISCSFHIISYLRTIGVLLIKIFNLHKSWNKKIKYMTRPKNFFPRVRRKLIQRKRSLKSLKLFKKR